MRLLVSLLVLSLLLLVPSARAQEASAWEPLGPGDDDSQPAATAAAPQADGSLLLLRGDQVLRRSREGSWSEVLTGGRGSFLAASGEGRPLALAVLGGTLYASLDGGQAWAATPLPVAEPRLELSPAFDYDATALYVAAGRMFRTLDGGVTWHEQIPVAGQRVQEVRFSPGFASDRTLVAAAVSGPFFTLTGDLPGDVPATEHETSAGVLLSTDGGQTWRAPGDGPNIDSIPFRHVQALAVSPAFTVDRTLFVYSWGPRPTGTFMGGGAARMWQGALFRSRDAGHTWEALRTSGPPSFQRVVASLGLSPAFQLDETLFLALSSSAVTPASGTCRVLKTVDAGASWAEVVHAGSYEACLGVVASPRFSDDRVVLTGKTRWTISHNGGLTWENLATPGGPPATSPVFAPDWWLYMADRAGAARLPPAPDRGDLPVCAIAPAGGFGRLWRANDALRTALGCPDGPEVRGPIRTRPDAGGGYLQVDSQESVLQLAADGSVRAVGPADVPGTGWVADDVVIQRYGGGLLIWDPTPPAGIRAIDFTTRRWRSFPDVGLS